MIDYSNFSIFNKKPNPRSFLTHDKLEDNYPMLAKIRYTLDTNNGNFNFLTENKENITKLLNEIKDYNYYLTTDGIDEYRYTLKTDEELLNMPVQFATAIANELKDLVILMFIGDVEDWMYTYITQNKKIVKHYRELFIKEVSDVYTNSVFYDIVASAMDTINGLPDIMHQKLFKKLDDDLQKGNKAFYENMLEEFNSMIYKSEEESSTIKYDATAKDISDPFVDPHQEFMHENMNRILDNY